MIQAKESREKIGDGWRVDTDSHTGKDYIGTKICVTKGGSTFSVTKDGDIISVCKKVGETMKASDILAEAVKAGGKKLDSFSGNFKFYVKNGFEPVSWTRFDSRYKPKGWVRKIDKKEAVVFFKYTGKKPKLTDPRYLEIMERHFYKKVMASRDYDTAMAKRDKEM